jgi:putative ABC transport system permease protein
MIRHYLASAFANIVRAPFTTAANVLTLALGLACFIAAWGIVSYWKSGDGYHGDADRTFVIGQSLTLLGQERDNPLKSRSTATLAKYLREDFDEIDQIARAYAEEKVPVAAGADKALLDGAFVDAPFLQMFDFDFLAGDPRHALDEPNSVVLTQDAARRLFGAGQALGKPVLIDGKIAATVTGVIAPVRQPSFMGASADAILKFDVLGNWNAHPAGDFRDASEFWLGTSGYTFVALKSAGLREPFERKLPAFVARRMPADAQSAARMRLAAIPVSELTVRGLNATLFQGNAAGLGVVSVLFGFGCLSLAIACVNFANLATAQAAGRAKEVGLRGVVGATRMDIVAQSVLESILLASMALVVALAFLAVSAPLVRATMNVDMMYFLADGAWPLAFLALLVVVVGLAAGAYPALVLSGVKPAQALRSGRSKSGPKFVARILVGIQFAAASFLLILLTVAQLQRSDLERTALATHEDPIVVLNDIQPIGFSLSAFAAELARRPDIQAVSGADTPPWSQYAVVVSLARSPDAAAASVQGYSKTVGHDYFEALDLGILAGRAFDRAHEPAEASASPNPSSPMPAVVDEGLVARLGFAAPSGAVDQIVFAPRAGKAARPVRIIGVVRSEPMRLASATTSGDMYFHISAPIAVTGHGPYPIVRLSKDRVAQGVAAINEVWDRFAPNVPADIQFFDELFEQNYRQYARVGQLFMTLAAIAFVISTTGLLGIAVHVASRRRHEIAVRKTLGSSVIGVIRLLLTDFSIPVFAGNLLAWPLGYLAAQAYLAAFAHRIDLTPAPFVLSMAITLLIAWAAVIGVVLKAASARPAEVLRNA